MHTQLSLSLYPICLEYVLFFHAIIVPVNAPVYNAPVSSSTFLISKHEDLTKCCFKIVSPPTALVQHWNNKSQVLVFAGLVLHVMIGDPMSIHATIYHDAQCNQFYDNCDIIMK